MSLIAAYVTLVTQHSGTLKSRHIDNQMSVHFTLDVETMKQLLYKSNTFNYNRVDFTFEYIQMCTCALVCF